MDDISSERRGIFEQWQKKQDRKSRARYLRIKPFFLYRESEKSKRLENAESSDLKNKKQPLTTMHALFTELHQQAEEIGVYRIREQNEDASSFIEMSQRLSQLRKDREKGLMALDMTINVATSKSLLGLGLASEKNDEQNLSLEEELSQLRVYESFPQFDWKAGHQVSQNPSKGHGMLDPRGKSSGSQTSPPAELPVEPPSVISRSGVPGLHRPIKRLPIRSPSGISHDNNSSSADEAPFKKPQNKRPAAARRGAARGLSEAALVTFANNINHEDIPALVYLEQDYV